MNNITQDMRFRLFIITFFTISVLLKPPFAIKPPDNSYISGFFVIKRKNKPYHTLNVPVRKIRLISNMFLLLFLQEKGKENISTK